MQHVHKARQLHASKWLQALFEPLRVGHAAALSNLMHVWMGIAFITNWWGRLMHVNLQIGDVNMSSLLTS
jgi:hypothetical protein